MKSRPRRGPTHSGVPGNLEKGPTSPTDIESRVRRTIRRHLEVDDARITWRASFIEDLGADSVSLIELTLALEEEFEIDISDEDAERIRTVEDAVDYIEQRTKEGGGTRVRSS